MRSVPVVLSLGSNLGDRRLHIRRAVLALSASVHIVRISSLWETEPVGGAGRSPAYLNAIVAGTTRLAPRELLGAAKRIEKDQGRIARHRNEPRPIDVDIVFYGAFLIRGPSLTVPHPRYRERAFVIEPLRDLGLSWVDPIDGRPLEGLRAPGVARRGAPMFGD